MTEKNWFEIIIDGKVNWSSVCEEDEAVSYFHKLAQSLCTVSPDYLMTCIGTSETEIRIEKQYKMRLISYPEVVYFLSLRKNPVPSNSID